MSKKQQYTQLLSVLANGSTNEARQLLKKHGIEDARNTGDLQLKLAKLYADSPDKLVIEKEFAQIHPHSKFILKYLSASQTPAGNAVQNKNEKREIIKSTVIDEGSSNFTGGLDEIKEGIDKMCNCNHCKCMYVTQNPKNYAHFDGTGAQPIQPQQPVIDYAGLIGLVGVLGIVFYALKNSK